MSGAGQSRARDLGRVHVGDSLSVAPGVSRHYSREYAELKQQFSGAPLDVSFRQLVGPLPANEYTHSLYPYPARLLRHIPRFLLSTDAVVEGIETVFDPFVGSGTVLLEAQLRGFRSIGVEQNPVAALVSRVKTRPSDVSGLAPMLANVLASAKKRRRVTYPSPLLDRWYTPASRSALGRLLTCITDGVADVDVARLCLALTARRLSMTDPRIPVPVRSARNADTSADDVWSAWQSEARLLTAKLSTLSAQRPPAEVREGDSRNLEMWPTETEAASTLLLTSPPYGAAQKYVRSTSLEAGWLGYAPEGRTAHLEHSNVGREHLSPKDRTLELGDVWDDDLRSVLGAVATKDSRRAQIYVAYFADMQRVFSNARASGVRRIALISGTNNVVGGVLHTNRHLADIVTSLGYRRSMSMRDPIRGRTLLTTRRNGVPSPAEFIDIFERTGDA